MSAPDTIPAKPRPDIARPRRMTTEDGATAEIKDPASNITSALTKVHFVVRIVYSPP